MPKPVTPFVGCDVFVLNEKNEVLLIQRSDNLLWAMPGGAHDLDETPESCAVRECFEESGLKIKVTELLGVFSSNRYEYINYPWKDNKFCHILFSGKIIGGEIRVSDESIKIGWFVKNNLPQFSDGHEVRVKFAFEKFFNKNLPAHFE